MYNGIVLDDIRRDAFLAMAAKEGLICEKGMTDGVFDERTCRMPSSSLAQRVLEQFTVAGAVYVDPHTYKCMELVACLCRLISRHYLLEWITPRHVLSPLSLY